VPAGTPGAWGQALADCDTIRSEAELSIGRAGCGHSRLNPVERGWIAPMGMTVCIEIEGHGRRGDVRLFQS